MHPQIDLRRAWLDLHAASWPRCGGRRHALQMHQVTIGTITHMSTHSCPHQVSDSITQFVAAAEAHEKDVPPESVGVASVAEVSRDAFVAAVCNAAPVRPWLLVLADLQGFSVWWMLVEDGTGGGGRLRSIPLGGALPLHASMHTIIHGSVPTPHM